MRKLVKTTKNLQNLMVRFVLPGENWLSWERQGRAMFGRRSTHWGCWTKRALKSTISPLHDLFGTKAHVFWEGHKILQNLHPNFDWHYIGQKWGEDFAIFCGLLRIYELYVAAEISLRFQIWGVMILINCLFFFPSSILKPQHPL